MGDKAVEVVRSSVADDKKAERILTCLEARRDNLALTEDFDPAATCLLVNMAQSVSPFEVACFFSWYAPVLHVHKLPDSVLPSKEDANYAVTFSDASSLEVVLSSKITRFDMGDGYENGRAIRVARFKEEEPQGYQGLGFSLW